MPLETFQELLNQIVKGYRKNVIVKLGRKKYKVYITSMIRPQQDFETEYQDAGNYYLELSMVIVKDVTVTLMGDIAGGISFEVNEALNKRKTFSCSVSENAKP